MINGTENNKKFQEIMEKVFSVIKSINKKEHIKTTRNYLNFWYNTYGEKNKELIELYFKSKIKEIK